MELKNRIESLVALGQYLENDLAKNENALAIVQAKNGWFTQDQVQYAIHSMCNAFLRSEILHTIAQQYNIGNNASNKIVGIVMAGNIPMVGLHDLVCVLLSGHRAMIKPSSKDEVLMQHIINFLHQENSDWQQRVAISPMLKNCDAYIATGSNNSALHFEQYFGKYPHIIRHNRTSVALLDGSETTEQLLALAHDVFLYFGLGCRSTTQLWVPNDYNFETLLAAFKHYEHLAQHHSYRNNYDYNLAIYLLNNEYYMTNGNVIMVENASPFSPISVLHYQYYIDAHVTLELLRSDTQLQCISTKENFGQSQQPSFLQYADEVDTMKFLMQL